jgi:hypothetical protein
VLSSLPVEEAGVNNPDVFLLTRNGLAESFKALNSTFEDYLDIKEKYLDDIEYDLTCIYGISIAVLAVCMSILVFSVIWLQRSFDKLLKNLTAFELGKAIEVKMAFAERILIFEGEEALLMSLQNEESIGITHSLRKSDQEVKLKVAVWKSLLAKLSLMLALVGGLLLVLYFVSFLNLRSTAEKYPDRIQISQQIRLSSLSMLAWTQMIPLQNTPPDIDISYTIQSYYPDPRTQLEVEIERLSNQILKGEDPAMSGLYFSKKSTITDSVPSDEAYFRYGLHSATLVLINDMRAIAEKSSTDELVTLTKLCLQFEDYYNDVITSLRDEVSTRLDNGVTEMEAVTICCSLLTLVLCALMYSTMFSALDHKVKWISKFLDIDYLR